MAGNYLKLNRHGTLYYFRRRIPDDLRLTLGRTQLIKSLGTGRRAEAIALARMLTAHTDKIFHRLRGMTENQKDTIRTDFTDCWEAEFEINGVKHKVRSQITDIKPGEEEAASRYANQTRTQALADAIAAGVNASNVLLSPALAMPDNRGELASGKTIMEVFEEFKEFQIAIGAQADVKGGWKNPGRVDVEQTQHIRAFVEFIGGDRPICEVCTEDVVGFKKFVMTTDTIGSAQSRKIRLNRTAAVFKYAKEELKYIKYGFTEEFKYKGKPKKNPYLKFTVSDLKALFESDAYRDHEHGSSSQYWLPLLGLYTGARINELCQLLCSDITEKDGVPIFSILDEEENKRLKTDAARRLVPVHSKLIELGFLDFVKTIPSGRIFPHLREAPDKPGDYGQKASEDFTEYRRSVGVGKLAGQGKSNKAFHSFRSTL